MEKIKIMDAQKTKLPLAGSRASLRAVCDEDEIKWNNLVLSPESASCYSCHSLDRPEWLWSPVPCQTEESESDESKSPPETHPVAPWSGDVSFLDLTWCQERF